MGTIRAIIFDVDGVLIDAKEWHYEALNRALASYGLEIGRQDHLTKFDGLPTSKKLEILSREKGLPENLYHVINEKKQQYTMELVNESCQPNEIHQFALSTLKAEGYIMAAASNAIRNTVQTMLAKSNLLQYLEFFLSNQDVKHPKPDPEIYLAAMERLHMAPQECLVVEDNQNGIRAAEAAGAHVMRVETVADVNYENIKRHIRSFEKIHLLRFVNR